MIWAENLHGRDIRADEQSSQCFVECWDLHANWRRVRHDLKLEVENGTVKRRWP